MYVVMVVLKQTKRTHRKRLHRGQAKTILNGESLMINIALFSIILGSLRLLIPLVLQYLYQGLFWIFLEGSRQSRDPKLVGGGGGRQTQIKGSQPHSKIG